MAEKAGTGDVVLPGTLTDLVKVLRELMGALGDIGNFVSAGFGLYDKHHARAAARHLNALSFTRDGLREPLERLASGSGSVDDIMAIELKIAATVQEVDNSLHELSLYREPLREKYGLAAAMKLDEIIHGPFCKEMLRKSLLALVASVIDSDGEF